MLPACGFSCIRMVYPSMSARNRSRLVLPHGQIFELWSRALKHKFGIGEVVYFTASNVSRPAASGTYEVIRLLPTDGDDYQYRIKSSTEAFERVARESQLASV